MLTGKARHLRYFSLSHLVSVDSTDADALLVDMEHNPSRLFRRLIEEALEHVDDEVHRRVVVVEKQHLVRCCFSTTTTRRWTSSSTCSSASSISRRKRRLGLCSMSTRRASASVESTLTRWL